LTAVPTGDPLVIIGQGYEITDWREAPDSDDWEGHLHITFTGGAPPFLYALENSEPQSDNLLYLRWLRCHDAPLTVHIWSADGQEAHKSVWVVSPYCP